MKLRQIAFHIDNEKGGGKPPPARANSPIANLRVRDAGMWLKILTILCGIGVLAMTGYIVFYDQVEGYFTDAAPVAATPSEPAGVTVLVKEPGTRRAETPILTAPAGGNAGLSANYAIDLGGAPSFDALSARFADIARLNAEIDFDQLEPRTVLRETLDGIEARLLVGPFDTISQARKVCGNIALPARVDCQPVRFAGELIARQ